MTKKILKVLGKSHALEILKTLSEKPMRFVDLKEVCKSNRTRTVRLKELKEEGLIRPLPKLTNDRAYTFYEITLKGRRTLKLVEKMVNLSSDEEKVQS